MELFTNNPELFINAFWIFFICGFGWSIFLARDLLTRNENGYPQ